MAQLTQEETQDLMEWAVKDKNTHCYSDCFNDFNFLKELEGIMIKEKVQDFMSNGLNKEPEIKILTHIVSSNHFVKIYELYHRGSRTFITDGSGATEKEAVLSALTNYREHNEKKI